MPNYTYTAKNQAGEALSGVVSALSETQAARVLRDKGWVVTSLKVEKPSLNPLAILKRVRGVRSADLVVFTRQLATMVEAGLPLTQALDILSQQIRNERLQKVAGVALQDVQGGSPLSESLAKHADVFNRIYTNLVRAGEASGSLDKILLRLAETQEKSHEFRSKVKGAMVYPTIVVGAMITVFSIIMIFVMPKLTAMYTDLGADLPPSTVILIGVSGLFATKWWLLLLILVSGGAGFAYFKSTPVGERWWATTQLRLPIFGPLKKQTDLTEFSRTLGLLIGSGLPILEALDIVGDSLGNLLYREAIKEAREQVARGIPLSQPLRADANFPPLLSQMVVVGEKTGRLDEVLGKVAIFFEREAEQTIKNLTTALEPAIMIALGLGVGLLVLSIITPIYSLTAQF